MKRYDEQVCAFYQYAKVQIIFDNKSFYDNKNAFRSNDYVHIYRLHPTLAHHIISILLACSVTIL